MLNKFYKLQVADEATKASQKDICLLRKEIYDLREWFLKIAVIRNLVQNISKKNKMAIFKLRLKH